MEIVHVLGSTSRCALVSCSGGLACKDRNYAFLAKESRCQKATEDQKLEQWKAELQATLQEGLEEKKAELKKDLDHQIETHKGLLQIQAIEHQVRFSRVYEKMIDVIAESTAKLHAEYDAVCKLVRLVDTDGVGKKEKFEIVRGLIDDFNSYFYPRRVYLPTDLFLKISRFHNRFAQTAADFNRGLRMEEQGRNGMSQEDYWKEALKAIDTEATPLFVGIHEACQAIMGFSKRDLSSPLEQVR